jgi:hypothetical protein
MRSLPPPARLRSSLDTYLNNCAQEGPCSRPILAHAQPPATYTEKEKATMSSPTYPANNGDAQDAALSMPSNCVNELQEYAGIDLSLSPISPYQRTLKRTPCALCAAISIFLRDTLHDVSVTPHFAILQLSNGLLVVNRTCTYLSTRHTSPNDGFQEPGGAFTALRSLILGGSAVTAEPPTT